MTLASVQVTATRWLVTRGLASTVGILICVTAAGNIRHHRCVHDIVLPVTLYDIIKITDVSRVYAPVNT